MDELFLHTVFRRLCKPFKSRCGPFFIMILTYYKTCNNKFISLEEIEFPLVVSENCPQEDFHCWEGMQKTFEIWLWRKLIKCISEATRNWTINRVVRLSWNSKQINKNPLQCWANQSQDAVAGTCYYILEKLEISIGSNLLFIIHFEPLRTKLMPVDHSSC